MSEPREQYQAEGGPEAAPSEDELYKAYQRARRKVARLRDKLDAALLEAREAAYELRLAIDREAEQEPLIGNQEGGDVR